MGVATPVDESGCEDRAKARRMKVLTIAEFFDLDYEEAMLELADLKQVLDFIHQRNGGFVRPGDQRLGSSVSAHP